MQAVFEAALERKDLEGMDWASIAEVIRDDKK